MGRMKSHRGPGPETCTMTHCDHRRNLGGHCMVTGCPNAKAVCPFHQYRTF